MSETAATCPTCNGPATKEDVDTTPPGVKPGRFKTVYRAIPTPAPDPLTALKEAVVEAAEARALSVRRWKTEGETLGTAMEWAREQDRLRLAEDAAVDRLLAARATVAQEAPR